MAAAATGALTMPETALSTAVAEGRIAPDRPLSDEVFADRRSATDAGSLEAIVDASGSLADESTEGIVQAHDTIRQEQRQEAAQREARRTREARRYVKPLDDYRISASFGSTGVMWSSTHSGIDLAASYGTSIMAVTTGEIIFSGWAGGCGNKVVVRQWDGTETWYCHMSRIIQRSGTVSPGDVIGAVGSTGNSTGPHLHLEVHPSGGNAIDPYPYMSDQGVDL